MEGALTVSDESKFIIGFHMSYWDVEMSVRGHKDGCLVVMPLNIILALNMFEKKNSLLLPLNNRHCLFYVRVLHVWLGMMFFLREKRVTYELCVDVGGLFLSDISRISAWINKRHCCESLSTHIWVLKSSAMQNASCHWKDKLNFFLKKSLFLSLKLFE